VLYEERYQVWLDILRIRFTIDVTRSLGIMERLKKYDNQKHPGHRGECNTKLTNIEHPGAPGKCNTKNNRNEAGGIRKTIQT
jgi:hypothetical protein